MLNTYIWDLDGTLIDSYGSIVSSLLDVAREAGREEQASSVLVSVKRGAVSSYLKELAEKTGRDYTDLYRRYREISHERTDEITLIPGALDTLEALRKAGAQHFVYTHRGSSAGPLLRRLGLISFFGEIVTFEYGFRPKPSGEGVEYLIRKYGLPRERTAYVGDRNLDVDCAKDAGVRAVLFLPGDSCVVPSGREDLIIPSLEALCRGSLSEML